jgi:uncharacterized repeat protein (TIGR03806 family)
MPKFRALVITLLSVVVPTATPASEAPGQGVQRIVAKPYLNMPETVHGALPARLSETGAFADVRTLKPIPAAVPYELIQAFWSDGASKARFVTVPEGRIGFSPTSEWTFPAGTVFVKTFVLPVDARDPARQRRLETRLLVVDRTGGVYGVVYRWRPDLSDADLLNESVIEPIGIRTADGTQHTQNWYYPSREDCLTCHTTRAGGVLGVKTRQMNLDVAFPEGPAGNQLLAWNRLGLFSREFDASQAGRYPRLARSDDKSYSLADRARSYLDANCSQCHRPGGTVAYFDARFDTPLEQQLLIDGKVLIDENIDRARVIAANDPWRSIALARIDTNSDIRMPPLARQTIDGAGVSLIREWIASLPGRPVLAPPVITPAGGRFRGPVQVSLSAEQGAVVRYTLDGSTPGDQDPLYNGPIEVTAPTILRARAYREGYTRSIAVQQNFLADD